MKKTYSTLVLALGVLVFIVLPCEADEGMWLFNNPPRKLLQDKYKFDPTDKWLEHVQKSSVRFNSGGSGSFVSADGLVMTNHHVGLDTLQKISTPEKDYVKDGYHAKTHANEVKSKALELNVLMSIEDVTDKVNAAVKPNMSAEEAFKARRGIMAEIEKESLDKTGLRSDVVTLYQGGQYHLYRFKKYTDVRLVFAPEQQIAFYGGDPDNFEYPRFDLDICFFRVYENDKPAKIEHYLKWSKAGATDDELVFVSGHPGRTDRLNTMADLEYQRNRQYPFSLSMLRRLEVLLSVYSGRSDENARQAKEDFFSVQNSRKARVGSLAGLLDPELMNKKKAEEKKLREAVAGKPKLKEAAEAWDNIAKAQKEIAKAALTYNTLERGLAFNSAYFGTARTILRAAEERAKPNSDRLREYRDSNKASLELQLFSDEPVYDELEIVKLTDSLTWLCSETGLRQPACAEGHGGQVAESTRHRTGEGNHSASAGDRQGRQAERPRQTPGALRWWCEGCRCFQGPDDRTGQACRSRITGNPQDH